MENLNVDGVEGSGWRQALMEISNEVSEEETISSDTEDDELSEESEALLSDVHKVDKVLGCRIRSEAELPSKESLSANNDEPNTDEENKNLEFLIKWVGKSYIHNTWVPETQLKAIAKVKLNNYLAKHGCEPINLCKDQWTRPQRILGVRGGTENEEEVLIKWCGLGYEECTWEHINEPVIRDSTGLINQFNAFEYEASHKDLTNDSTNREEQDIGPLMEQPKELKGGTLFPHQLEALNWLRSCWHQSKNVILADEMGLGKTISASAFLSALYCEFRVGLPSLVLVPLSTMPNWEAEFSTWVPHLNVVGYYGNARARALICRYEWHAGGPGEPSTSNSARPYKFDIILTTYDMVLVDAVHLQKIAWALLIVDEGHRLKNSNSRLFCLLNKFSFQQRVLLTGTPLQNNLGEMFNLLKFLQPDSFPSLSAFEEKINDLPNADKVDELKKVVAPYMLRRLKKDTVHNLPPKTELVVPVELSPIQAEYYRAMLTKNYTVLCNMGRGTSGSGGSHKQSLLNIVMQLRKICNHPYLIAGTEPEYGSPAVLHRMRIKASGKLSLLHLMLRHLHAGGHRVLIFSQMTKLLDILEDYILEEFGSETYERVDGSVSVTERQAAIARFNEDKTRFVFLLSTRSCGLGINLATADTVIVYDSDFNPHADIQAISRAHRIGQTNGVVVYRLMVQASVEERILQLAKKKLMLDQLFVNKCGSQKEVEDILKWGTRELFRKNNGNQNGNSEYQGENSNNNSTNNADEVREQQHTKRVGGLGDVYDNRCLESCTTKLAWDEIAVEKLLDRSGMQDGREDNDLLGSVKALDWNAESNNEPNMADAQPNTAGEDEENQTTERGENGWDELLRARWEQCQVNKEASLGRGKRQRKSSLCKDMLLFSPTETLSESSDEDQGYTPAGQAHKEKYARIRSRQKERLAQRQITAASLSMPLADTTKPAELLEPVHQPGPSAELIPTPSKCDNLPILNQNPHPDIHLPICAAPPLSRQPFGPVSGPYHSYSLSQMPGVSPIPELGLPARHQLMLGKGKNVQHVESSTSCLPIKKLKVDIWSEYELSSLCIGVHKHGCGNWDKMLRDPELSFSSFKTVEDLSAKWCKEMVQYYNGYVSKPAENKPGLSINMPANALQGNRVSSVAAEGLSPSFHSHRTDVQLGSGDLYQALGSGSLPPVSTPINQINAIEKTGISLNNRPPILRNTFVPVSSTPCEIGSDQYGNAPDGSHKQAQYLHDYGSATKMSNKLPHWLREPVDAPSPSLSPPVPVGPIELPEKSAAEQCNNELHEGYGAEKRIPTFQIKDPGVSSSKGEKMEGEGSSRTVGVSNRGLRCMSFDLNYPPISCEESENSDQGKCEERKGCSDQAVYVLIDSSSDEELD